MEIELPQVQQRGSFERKHRSRDEVLLSLSYKLKDVTNNSGGDENKVS